MIAVEMLAVLNDVEFMLNVYIQWPFNGNSQLSRRSEKHHITTSSNSVIRMGESKGYCFITFANIESANAAPCDGLPIWGC